MANDLKQLETAVEKLTWNELSGFWTWFEEYANDRWDQQIEEDVKAGKFDAMAEKALREHEAGRSIEL